MSLQTLIYTGLAGLCLVLALIAGHLHSRCPDYEASGALLTLALALALAAAAVLSP